MQKMFHGQRMRKALKTSLLIDVVKKSAWNFVLRLRLKLWDGIPKFHTFLINLKGGEKIRCQTRQ
jgi:hypothetical protein